MAGQVGPLLTVGNPHWHKGGPEKGAVLRICSLLVTHAPVCATQPAHPRVCANPLGSCGTQQFLKHFSCALLWWAGLGFHTQFQQRDGVRVLGEVWSPNCSHSLLWVTHTLPSVCLGK